MVGTKRRNRHVAHRDLPYCRSVCGPALLRQCVRGKLIILSASECVAHAQGPTWASGILLYEADQLLREDAMSAKVPDLFEIMATTRSMRRLKPDPVPVELIRKILEAGVSAPSGGNMQRWRFLVIRDPMVKRTVGSYYKRAWDELA